MAFCFDTREDAAQRLAERGGVNYRHHFIEAPADGLFVLYHTTDPVPGYQFETVHTLGEAFELLEKLPLRPEPALDPVLERDKPLVWELGNLGDSDSLDRLEADDGVGLYIVCRHNRRRWLFGPRITDYTASYSTFLRFIREHGPAFYRRVGPAPKPDVSPSRFKTVEAAKAACERHYVSRIQSIREGMQGNTDTCSSRNTVSWKCWAMGKWE